MSSAIDATEDAALRAHSASERLKASFCEGL
jgi:hypothetical protein